MKKLILVAVLFAGCSADVAVAPSTAPPTSVATVAPTPAPTPMPIPSPTAMSPLAAEAAYVAAATRFNLASVSIEASLPSLTSDRSSLESWYRDVRAALVAFKADLEAVNWPDSLRPSATAVENATDAMTWLVDGATVSADNLAFLVEFSLGKNGADFRPAVNAFRSALGLKPVTVFGPAA